MEYNKKYGRERDWDDQHAPSPSSIQDPGSSANPGMDAYPIHPRHPRASFYKSDVTQGMGLEHNYPSNHYVPPWPHASADSASSWAAPAAYEYDDERGAISRPTIDQNWPLTQSPAEYTWENAPYRPPPGRPQQPHLASLATDHAFNILQTPISIRRPDQTYKSASYSYQSPSQMTSSDYTWQEFHDSPNTPTSTPSVKRISSLGPPSSRRGHSMLYSTPSLVPPIVEEKLSIGSRSSWASSAAMPESKLHTGVAIGEPMRNATQFDESSVSGRDGDWIIDQYGDTRSIASSARCREEPLITVPSSQPHFGQRHGEQIRPLAVDPFNGGSVFMDLSSDSSNTFITHGQTPETSPGTERNLASPPYMISNSMSPPNLAELSGSPQPLSRLHTKRPPRLDMDSVREAESRGSLTSLPDLILRATKLADLMDKGKRPSSRLDDLDQFDEKSSIVVDNHRFDMLETRRSGLSDMLDSFPPPAHTPQNDLQRDSLYWTGSWPMIPSVQEQDGIADDDSEISFKKRKQARRCCGCPAWVFFLIPLLVLCLIIVVVLPLELGQKHDSGMTLGECQKSLTCLHGGINVVFKDTCSCICTNGFTGSTCDVGGSEGCITTNLVATDGSSRINNVTLGRAVPHVIADSVSNFSIPLSATAILAKFNAANLSCIAQNSLVTFDGQDTSRNQARAVVGDPLFKAKDPYSSPAVSFTSTQAGTTPKTGTFPVSWRIRKRSSSSSATSDAPAPTAAFTVTEKALEFARTVVLYVLQEEDIDAASSAQGFLQQFFDQANATQSQHGNLVTVQDASDLNVGGNNTVNLVSADINIGQGSVVHQKSVKHEAVSVLLGNHGS